MNRHEDTAVEGACVRIPNRPAITPGYNKAAHPAPKVAPPATDELAALHEASWAAPEFTLLDVATGPGMLAKAAAMRGATKAVGVDQSSEFIALAQPVAEAFPDVVSFQGARPIGLKRAGTLVDG